MRRFVQRRVDRRCEDEPTRDQGQYNQRRSREGMGQGKMEADDPVCQTLKVATTGRGRRRKRLNLSAVFATSLF